MVFEYQETKAQVEKMLKIKQYEIKDQDNLIELGINSLKIMRLVNEWRKKGAKVTFAELISQPTFSKWWQILSAVNEKSAKKELTTLPLPKQGKKKQFDLTDVQYAYWIGRKEGQVLGGIGCHAYLEIDSQDIDPEQLKLAWNKLVQHHPALRTRFTEEGKQEILSVSPWSKMGIYDLREHTEKEVERTLTDIRGKLSHRKLRVEEGENAGLALTLLPENKNRIHFDVDLLSADVQSFQILLRDLAKLYRNEALPAEPEWNFGAYLEFIEEQSTKSQQKAEAFWKERIPDMPLGPQLPLLKNPQEIDKTVFTTREASFSPAQWENIKKKAAQFHITPAMFFLTIYCEILAHFSEESRFLINMPIFNRRTEFDGIEEVVADFSNILLLEADCRETKSFIDRARQLQETFYRDIQHAEYSGIQVTRNLAQYYPEEKCIAPVVFACNLGEPLLDEDLRKTFGELSFMQSQTPQVFIDFQMFDYNDGLYIRWDAVEELFYEGMLDQMFGTCCQWIGDLSAADSDWGAVLSVSCVEQGMVKRNETYNLSQPIRMNSLLDGFFEHARKQPEKIAIVESETGETITYRELSRRCLNIAAYLQDSGVRQGDMVAVSMEREIFQTAGVLGILAAGAGYTPIGLGQPKERRRAMYQKADVRYVLTNSSGASRIDDDLNVRILFVEESDGQPPLMDPVFCDASSRGYVIFTSGSTGEPKGVEISHQGAVNTIEAVNQKCQVEEADAVLAVSSLEFDLSVYDIFGILNAGATLVTIPEQEQRNADYWVHVIREHNITIWNSVPILFDMLLIAAKNAGRELDSLRWVFLSGDWIGLTLPERMKEQAPQAEMLAMGGATEASIWSNYFHVTLPLNPRYTSIPYGYPLSNQKYCIMDEKGHPCPDWVPGELWIGGKGVALSYVNDPELTSQKFVEYQGERWYRTGDMGRYWNDGTIEFLGRKDFQVKIRGHRIELGEIEHAITKHESVKEAVVLARQMPSGQKELLAYLVPDQTEEKDPDLKQYLAEQIPEYMIPKHFIILDALPLSSNGKIDRKKLEKQAAGYEGDTVQEKQRPVTETGKKLSEIWQKVLEQDDIYMEDSYFLLGGNSLTAAQLSAAIQAKFNVRFMIEQVFDYAVFFQQVELLEQLLKEKGGLKEVPVLDLPVIKPDKSARYQPFPMTEIQRAYWVGRKGIYDMGNISTHYYFEIENNGFDRKKFKKAINCFIASHDMMHAVILDNGEQQVVQEEIPPYSLTEYHMEKLSLSEIEEKVQDIREELAHRVFQPEEWPLFDFRISLLPNQKVRLHLCFDNIIFDGSSIFYFFDEINRMYEQDEYLVQEPAVTFRDYILEVEKMKQTPDFEQDRTYWMNRLYTLPQAPELPTREFEVHTFAHQEQHLSAEKWERLKENLVKIGGITPSVFLITAYAEILATWSRHQKFTLNLTRFNRMPLHADINKIIGDFTSLTLLEISMESKSPQSFLERLKAVQRQLLQDLEHPLFCGVQMLRELGKRNQNRQGALMPVVFTSSLGLKAAETEGTNWFENRVFSSSETPQVWLDHQVTEENGSLVLIWDYIEEIFPENMVNEMFEAYIALLNHLGDDFAIWEQADICLIDVPKIRQFELDNQHRTSLSKETLVSLFERQAKKTPDHTAIIHGDKEMTYRDLAGQVDILTNVILSVKEQKSELIGILMEKGPEQVAAAFAIMKSGAAYLPLDVNHPPQRISNLLEKARVSVVITQSWLDKEGISLQYQIEADTVLPSDSRLTFPVVKPEDTAYVIYTSGSTGMPKGVTISHESVVNTILDINQRFQVNEQDRSIALSNLNFDLSVYDIFGLLSAGGAIVIPEEQQLKNPARWMELVIQYRVSIWNTVPAFMQMLVDYKIRRKESDSIRLIMMSGDWIPMTLPVQVKKLFPNSTFVSLGGATEAAIWSNYYVVDKLDPSWNSIPYGKPLDNQTLLIYNDRMQPCPRGICGDLYIGGAGVANGYWKDEERTAEQFIIHPVTKERIYKTGDLARYMEDGNIEFLGREDNQVKIRGFRIELGEIESTLKQYPQVKEAVVLAGKTEPKQLIAFVTPEKKENHHTHPELLIGSDKQILKIQAEMEKQVNRDKMRCMTEEMNTVSICGAADILRKLGMFTESTSTLSISGKISEQGIDLRYTSLIEHWLKQLEQQGAVTKMDSSTDEYQWNPSLNTLTLTGQYKKEFPHSMKDLVKYYEETMDIYLPVLKGKKDAVSLLLEEDFAQASKDLVFYQWVNQFYYNTAVRLLNNYTDMHGTTEKVKILEIGTRFGSLLNRLHESHLWERWEYTYSDESRFFLQEKEKQYKDICTSVFDMNKPIEGQEPADQKYQVILADNGLHRAKDIDITLKNIKKMLSPEGVLIFIENTSLNCFDLNIAGLYEYGFSQFEDQRKESKQPFLSKGGWKERLKKNEMELIGLFCDSEEIAAEYGRYLYIAKAKQYEKQIDTSDLSRFLTEKLPEYMIPNRYTVLSKFPLTTNGKIDRKWLLNETDHEKMDTREIVDPQNDVEHFILKLWKEILQLDSISVEDNFFEVGGDSLLAIQCMNRLNQEYVADVSLQDIFSANSIRNLSDLIMQKKKFCEDRVEGEI